MVVAGVPGTEGVDCQDSSRKPNQCVHVSFRLESLKPVGKLRLHTLEQELMLQPTGGISPSSGRLYFGS